MLSFLMISGLYYLHDGHISSGFFGCDFCVFVHLKKTWSKYLLPNVSCLQVLAFFFYSVSFGHKIRAVFVLGIWLILGFVSSFKYTGMQLLK